MTAPRPVSRASLAYAGNRFMYAAVAALILKLTVDNALPGPFVFLAALGVGYGLLTLIHNTRRTDSPEETP
ncbi:hypothetical protein GCM10011608_10390 [Micromonospora sonchi]|uniref:Uncharacterized protein n=1 Tax=Micromonospora sonchi TaxID=1763543 RepID=A0A917WTK2_9ACTN|nr:hypothetical protein [Micromonospora sonchi]GGM27515.1 hypothetical protein GCM10011608_10390 [Micromonospora sonchi]